ncbi:MAG: glycosyl hydrolase family 18 protein [Treponemataceae bacterium]
MKYFKLYGVGLFFSFLALSSFGMGNKEKAISDQHSVAEETQNIVEDNSFNYDLAEFPSLSEAKPLVFDEIWAYVLEGRENTFNTAFPISDVGYFGATIGTFGKLAGVPDRKKFAKYTGRVHLVIADTNRSLTHFSLNPEYPVRDVLIKDIIDASKPYDGLQIDFEYVHKNDKENFISFLRELKRRLPKNKIFSIAVPARTRKLQNDIFDYDVIAKIADRMLVMAYDEHWSGSKPGPVASFSWGRNVAKYCVEAIPAHKLIMGLPLYGRAWTSDRSAGAYRLTSGRRIMDEQGIKEAPRKDGVPHLSYEVSSTVTLYYDDVQSLYERSILYTDLGVKSIGFWRMGLEDTNIWSLLQHR